MSLAITSCELFFSTNFIINGCSCEREGVLNILLQSTNGNKLIGSQFERAITGDSIDNKSGDKSQTTNFTLEIYVVSELN